MEGKQINDTVGESSRFGSAQMAPAAYFRPPLPRQLFSPLNMSCPTVHNSSNYTSGNHTPNFNIRDRRQKVGDFASSGGSEMSERSELMSLENLHISVSRDDEIDYFLLKESSTVKEIAPSERFVAKPQKNSTSRQYSRSGDDFEKKTVVSDGEEFMLKPVKKRIVCEIKNKTSEKQKSNTPPFSPMANSGRSSEKLKDTAPKAKSNKMVSHLGTKTKSINGGSLNPFTAADFAPKTWNLRPRQPPISNSKGRGPNLQGSTGNTAEAQKSEKTKKIEFSVSLSKAEIEADFLAMTGSKPPRRLQKRGRVVQKHVDHCFPGLWLHSITPNSYRVPDKELKI